MSECFIGEIRMFGGNFAPQDWALCDGGTLPISGNEALFALIGTTYGGDGITNFKLPDLRGRIPIHKGQGPNLSNRVIGSSFGTETVTLNEAHIPAHTHLINAGGDATTAAPAGAYPGNANYALYSAATPDSTMSPAAVAPMGAAQPHPNMMPSLCINFIIALNGIFPTQN